MVALVKSRFEIFDCLGEPINNVASTGYMYVTSICWNLTACMIRSLISKPGTNYLDFCEDSMKIGMALSAQRYVSSKPLATMAVQWSSKVLLLSNFQSWYACRVGVLWKMKREDIPFSYCLLFHPLIFLIL